jgi:mono/diheme cytochrome c family protein
MSPWNSLPVSAAALMLGWSALFASAAVHLPKTAANVDEGTLLLGELNCTACHAPDPAAAARLKAHGAPRFTKTSPKLSAAWVRGWLLDPSREKPGTSMPSVLHGMAESDRKPAAEALAHYLASLNGTNGTAGLGADPTRVDKGRQLFHTVGCVACHAPETASAESTPESLKRAQSEAVPLGDLGRKYFAGDLALSLIHISEPTRLM